ncbi:hypothetical protein HDU97_000861 [Phlyctochytrium planicorne]|nr:hypothetical protein HDU97_000861 [Phlyctochytrium planicorne]
MTVSKNLPPGPPTNPLVGDTFSLAGASTAVFVYGPKALKEVFYNDDLTIRGGTILPPVADVINVSQGPVPSLDGEVHRERKASLVAANVPANTDSLLAEIVVPILKQWKQDLIDRINEAEEKKIDVKLGDVFRNLFMKVIVAGIFGIQNPDDQIIKDMLAVESSMDTVPINLPFSPYRNAIAARDRLFKVWRGQAELHLMHPENYKSTLLSALIAHKRALSLDELTLESHHFFFGALGIIFLTMNSIMGLHGRPEWKDKLIAELDANDATLENPSAAALDKLVVLNAIVKETLRVYPIIPIQTAKAKTHFTYEGYDVPEGAVVVGGFHATNQDPELYENPELFNPDRFLNPPKRPADSPFNDADLNMFTWVPFGGGDRAKTHKCAGYPTAIAIGSLFIGYFFKNFKAEVKETQAYDMKKIVVEPTDRFPVVLRSRDLKA